MTQNDRQIFETTFHRRVDQIAESCVACGKCYEACPITDAAKIGGLNSEMVTAGVRDILRMGNGSKEAEKKIDPGERKSQGADAFKALGRGVKVLSKIQLTTEDLGRLGQGQNASVEDEGEPPDYVFYTGCNVLKTPHIALLCLDIMDALDIRYRVLGGPSHCCGILQYRAGDLET